MSFASPLTEQDNAKKAQFAAELLRSPEEPFQAARRIFPFAGDTGKALYAASTWPLDAEVIAAQKQLIEENGEEAYLPSKARTAAELWKMFQDPKVANKDRATFAKLYMEITGYAASAKGPGGGGGAGEGGDPEDAPLPSEPAYRIVTE